MAHGISDPKNKKEHFDTATHLEKKLDQLAQWIKESQHFIVFTGAGVSTSTGIPDFRSGMDTVLPTGPGAWELEDHRAKRAKTTTVIDDVQKAIPSPTHMALVALQRQGILKCIISQNCDGLHLRSGVNSNNLAELHGNMNLEKCPQCGAKYLRDYDTEGNRKHYTGRRCDKPSCRGRLKDSIINFGEDLPEDELNKALDHAGKADLCLVLGSSLTVTPASDIPERVVENKQKLVIGNLQRTPFHKNATLNIHAFSDVIMQGVMQRLNIPIPPWILRRRVHITCSHDLNHENQKRILIEGRDPNDADIPFTLFDNIEIIVNQKVVQQLIHQPFAYDLGDFDQQSITIRLHFFGHYNEIPFDLTYGNLSNISNNEQFYLLYNPMEGQWRKVTGSDDLPL
ncbi:unnamed protein product [Adineta steineri]|uniref:protein acetyllysine N-acetyltransferase n=1 Tax=Adineta steineri TaxID=433720 RepID=A0A814H1K2_9BILA|nr:unnamed protein product [Adineta steineri]CAF1036252.1 unnamed protein product [Adineta steineri]CAF1104350.1 unnamed protein product [Adineta steineri]